MHDVAKSKSLERKGSIRWIRRVVYSLIFILVLAGLIFGLNLLRISPMIIVVAVVTALIIWFGFVAFRRFRSGRTISGAVFIVLALFLVLVDFKALQFTAMGAMAKTMVPPPTTVTSATVKEEDWAPTLSAVGSISAVQGAVVSSELGGVVSKISF